MSPNNVIRRSLQVCNVGLGQLALKATKLWLHDLCWRVCTIAIKGKKSWDRMSFLEELANSQGKEVANSQGKHCWCSCIATSCSVLENAQLLMHQERLDTAGRSALIQQEGYSRKERLDTPGTADLMKGSSTLKP
eukprot:scaffold181654_cov24-Tisochrysis_lutea.AAC.3